MMNLDELSKLSIALLELREGCQFRINSEGVITWLSPELEQPSQQEIDDWIASPPAPVPQSISDRQFYQQLAVGGIISEQEALDSNAAVIPPPLLALVDALPEEARFNAKMLLSGATIFERNHPMTEAIRVAYGMTSGQLDDFFRAAALL